MMPKFIDLTGKKFGRLTVIERVVNDMDRHALWRCICRCGNETQVRGTSLNRGQTTSCGCRLTEHRRKYKSSCYSRGIRGNEVPEIDDLHDLVKW